MEQMDIRYTYSWMGDLQSYPGGHGWSKPSFSKKNGNVDQYPKHNPIVIYIYVYVYVYIPIIAPRIPSSYLLSKKKTKNPGLSLDVEDDILS